MVIHFKLKKLPVCGYYTEKYQRCNQYVDLKYLLWRHPISRTILNRKVFELKFFGMHWEKFFESIERGQKNNLEMSSLQILHIKITQKLSKNIFWINTICLQILCSLHVQFSHVVCLNLHQFFSLLMWIKITRYNQYLITFAKQSFKMLYRQFFLKKARRIVPVCYWHFISAWLIKCLI